MFQKPIGFIEQTANGSAKTNLITIKTDFLK